MSLVIFYTADFLVRTLLYKSRLVEYTEQTNRRATNVDPDQNAQSNSLIIYTVNYLIRKLLYKSWNELKILRRRTDLRPMQIRIEMYNRAV